MENEHRFTTVRVETDGGLGMIALGYLAGIPALLALIFSISIWSMGLLLACEAVLVAAVITGWRGGKRIERALERQKMEANQFVSTA